MKRAIWTKNYDIHEDQMYDCPGCPDCEAPLDKYQEGEYLCEACGNHVKVDNPEMIKWFTDREGSKVEWGDCILCGEKGTLKNLYAKNPVTLKWQVISARCTKCGAKMIV